MCLLYFHSISCLKTIKSLTISCLAFTHTATQSGGLSNYKPSTLMVEIPDNNIDNRLGVRNLVVSDKQNGSAQAPPIARARANAVDQWSANNGSVIYAQSNNHTRQTARNGLTSASSVNQIGANTYAVGAAKQSAFHSDQSGHTRKTTTFAATGPPNQYNNESHEDATSRGNNMQLNLGGQQQLNGEHTAEDAGADRVGSRDNETSGQSHSRPIQRYGAPSEPTRSTSDIFNDVDTQDLSSQAPPNHWSKGTCAMSDLLF